MPLAWRWHLERSVMPERGEPSRDAGELSLEVSAKECSVAGGEGLDRLVHLDHEPAAALRAMDADGSIARRPCGGVVEPEHASGRHLAPSLVGLVREPLEVPI